MNVDRDPAATDPGPVERRTVPRAPLPGVIVESLVRDNDPPEQNRGLLGPADVVEFGLESLFISGPGAAALGPGESFRVALRHSGRTVKAVCHCVRREVSPRCGVVLRLDPGEAGEAGRALFTRALEPSSVPPNLV